MNFWIRAQKSKKAGIYYKEVDQMCCETHRISMQLVAKQNRKSMIQLTQADVDPGLLRSIALINGLVRISRSPRWRKKSRNFTFTDRCEQAQIVAWERNRLSNEVRWGISGYPRNLFRMVFLPRTHVEWG